MLARERHRWGAGLAIGAGQNGVIGIHNGLHFIRGVCGNAVDQRAVKRAVDGGQVGSADTRDTGGLVHADVGRSGGGTVILRGNADGVQRWIDCSHRCSHDGLQLVSGIQRAVGGRGLDGGQDGGQVEGRNAGNAQCVQVGHGDGRGLGIAATGCVNDMVGRVGQVLHLGFCRHSSLEAAVHHVIQ